MLYLQNSPPESPAMSSYKKEKGDTLPRRSGSISSQRRSMYCDLDDASPDLSSFRPVTLTVKSFFKQVSRRDTNLLPAKFAKHSRIDYAVRFYISEKTYY